MSQWTKNGWIRAYWAVSAVVVLTIAGRGLLGHMMGIAYYYQWRANPTSVGMALPTAICLVLLGGSVGALLLWKDNG